MHPPPEPQPRHRRYSTRHQARLDAETHAKLEELARTFRQKRAAVLRYVMQWALTHTQTWTIDPSIPDRPYLVHMLLEPEVLQQVQEAAAAHGADVAAWERHAMRQVTPEDFPESWRAEDIAIRSYDSDYYGRRFQLRLNSDTQTKLGTLMQTFDRAISHNKVMIIDGETIITGSFNFTKAAQEKNAENLLIIRDPALAAQYIENWKVHAQHSQPYVGRGVRG